MVGLRLHRCGADWGARGGRTARELALWVQLQRELRHRGLLQPVAEYRLNAIGMQWQPQVRPPAACHYQTCTINVQMLNGVCCCNQPSGTAHKLVSHLPVCTLDLPVCIYAGLSAGGSEVDVTAGTGDVPGGAHPPHAAQRCCSRDRRHRRPGV